MCLSPVTIINPTKFISLKHRTQMLLQVPCGHCAECEAHNSNVWQFRTLYEFDRCISSGGFCLFDTLTYDNKHLPTISDSMSCDVNMPCFNRRHLTLFMKRLRTKLDRSGYKDTLLRYFISSEYGTRVDCTHRPHYHLLLFVNGSIDPLILSRFISDCWIYGRTDGTPWKSNNYVLSHNLLKDISMGNILRTCNYVTKYVQKSCQFQRELDKRVSYAMYNIARKLSEFDPDKWLESYEASKIRQQLRRRVNQFHVQSHQYGASLLETLDLNELFRDGCVYMPHFQQVKIPIALPMYYKRKLFYDLIECDGNRYWSLNDLGQQYNVARRQSLYDNLVSRFKGYCFDYHFDFDCAQLADYVLNKRGRIKGLLEDVPILDRIQLADLYGYITCSDKEQLLYRGYTPYYIGNAKSGYTFQTLPRQYSIAQFLEKYIYMDYVLENQLDLIYKRVENKNKERQDAFALKQHLSDLFK